MYKTTTWVHRAALTLACASLIGCVTRRNLIELASIELVGKLTKTPYFRRGAAASRAHRSHFTRCFPRIDSDPTPVARLHSFRA